MYVCMYVCICVQAFSTASAPSAAASTLAMLGSTDRELEEKVLVALGALVTDAGLFFVFFFFFFTANSRRRLLVALGALVKDADILNIALGEPKNGAVLQPISADMRFQNQESGIGNPESGSVSGLFCYSAIQKRPGTATPDSRFLNPESHVCGNGL